MSPIHGFQRWNPFSFCLNHSNKQLIRGIMVYNEIPRTEAECQEMIDEEYGGRCSPIWVKRGELIEQIYESFEDCPEERMRQLLDSAQCLIAKYFEEKGAKTTRELKFAVSIYLGLEDKSILSK